MRICYWLAKENKRLRKTQHLRSKYLVYPQRCKLQAKTKKVGIIQLVVHPQQAYMLAVKLS